MSSRKFPLAQGNYLFSISSVTSFSQDWCISFFWFLAQRRKIVMPKMWRSLIFEKKLFAADFGQKRPEKEVFEDFFEVGSIVSSDFLHKDGHMNTLECDGSRFLRNIFLRLILAKNGLKKRFLRVFSRLVHYFFRIFTQSIWIPTNAREPDC